MYCTIKAQCHFKQPGHVAGGTVTAFITLALFVSIPIAEVEPGFILQSLRAGNKACKHHDAVMPVCLPVLL